MLPALEVRKDANISLRDGRAQEFPDKSLSIRVGSASRGLVRDKLKRDLEATSVWGGTRSSTQFLTLAVSLPDHDVALVTSAVIRALCIGALPLVACLWLLTLVYVCEHTEKA